jgi:hypothetical protein
MAADVEHLTDLGLAGEFWRLACAGRRRRRDPMEAMDAMEAMMA